MLHYHECTHLIIICSCAQAPFECLLAFYDDTVGRFALSVMDVHLCASAKEETLLVAHATFGILRQGVGKI